MSLKTRGYGTRQRAADATMRVSDAERAEVADQLAQHYGDGRLDQAELDERLGRAMGAKTQADLAGITADLPHLDPRPGSRRRRGARQQRPGPPAPRSQSGRQRRILPVVLLIVLGLVAWHAVTPFFWAAVLARAVVRVRVVAVRRAADLLLAALRPPAPSPLAGAPPAR